MSKQPFEKFINKADTGAKKKEVIRREKKQFKAELKAKGDEMNRQNEDKYRTVTSDNRRKPEEENPKSKGKGQKKDNWERKPKSDKGEFKPDSRRSDDKRAPAKAARGEGRPDSRRSDDKRAPAKTARGEGKPDARRSDDKRVPAKATRGEGKPDARRSAKSDTKSLTLPITGNQPVREDNGIMPLNKYIAHAGICARREAAELVKEGVVTVNGDKILEPGFKVNGSDKVTVKGKLIYLQKNLVYVLLNKPKDYLTTAKDPEGRKTVLDLVKGATQERIYSVGRLDRNTTGVLLLTNDGELAQKLTHPSFEIKKIYEVRLDKPVLKKDLDAIASGITLEDGFVQADSVGYADSKDKSVVGIEIHSGRNRIVRRIFEHLGYDVKNLDRVLFANLTKKNVERGKWRILSEKEVRLLKYMNQSFVKKKEKKDAEN